MRARRSFTLHSARYTLHAARCTLRAARCTLHAVAPYFSNWSIGETPVQYRKYCTAPSTQHPATCQEKHLKMYAHKRENLNCNSNAYVLFYCVLCAVCMDPAHNLAPITLAPITLAPITLLPLPWLP